MVLVSAGSCQQKALALYDTVSTVSLVTSRLANSLQVARIKYSDDISSLGEEQNFSSNSMIFFTLASAHSQQGPAIEIAAHVVDNIWNSNYRSDRDLHLADPNFGTSRKFDLHFSIEHCNRFGLGKEKVSHCLDLKAFKTIHG